MNSMMPAIALMLSARVRGGLRASVLLSAFLVTGCGGSDAPTTPARETPTPVTPPVTPPTPTIPVPTTLGVLGLGAVSERYTSEVWVRGTTAYTTSWGSRAGIRGNAIKIWDVEGNTPVLVDSVIVASAGTLGDVQVSDDGTLLVVAIESNPNGGLATYALDTPRKPRLLTRTTGGELRYGVHTAEVARVNGVLYAFCSIDPTNGVVSRLITLDLTDPAAPKTVASVQLGSPFVHDVFVRDGMLFTAEWNDGVGIWDIGAQTGTVASPRRVGTATIRGGQAHNVWWYHDPVTANKSFLFVGEEGPGVIGSSSVGDVHVVDISMPSAAREVAVFSVAGAGVHNFSVDEANGLLYAAYYNAGVRVLDIRGDLATCTVKLADGRCDLGASGREKARFAGGGTSGTYVWGVHWSPSGFYASDMLNGLYKLSPATR